MTDRLSDKHVARLVQATALAAGIRGDLPEGERRHRFAGHSLRAGLATAALFVWAHDACHGTVVGSRRAARALATVAMLPSLQVERLWAYGHNRVHHGFTSLSTVDWIWRPWTPAAYAAARPAARLLYRLERRPATCGLHYLLRVWWPGMVRFSRPGAHLSKAVVVAFATGLAVVAWVLGGPLSVLAALVVPFAVFTWTIALFVYLHHTHPDIPFFDDRATWSACSSRSSTAPATGPLSSPRPPTWPGPGRSRCSGRGSRSPTRTNSAPPSPRPSRRRWWRWRTWRSCSRAAGRLPPLLIPPAPPGG